MLVPRQQALAICFVYAVIIDAQIVTSPPRRVRMATIKRILGTPKKQPQTKR